MMRRPFAGLSFPHTPRRRRHSRPGAEPGTLVSAPEARAPEMRVLAYGPEGYVEEPIEHLEGLEALRRRWPVVWLDVAGLGDPDLIARIGEAFGLHDLALEDVLNTDQRPKLEPYADHLFIVTRLNRPDAPGPDGEQLALFLGRDFVITFQEVPGDPLEAVRRRIRGARPQMRRGGADHLAYAILDAVVDHYFPVLEGFADEIEALEEELTRRPEQQVVGRIYALRRDLVSLRRILWPMRDALNGLMHDTSGLMGDETRVYLRDAYDHVLRMLEIVETDRDNVSSLLDSYITLMSARMNEVMKVLTVIATIFIPLTFVTGIYGMNFDPAASPLNMPELRWYYGYPFVLSGMVLLAILLGLYFHRQGWLRRDALLPRAAAERRPRKAERDQRPGAAAPDASPDVRRVRGR